MKRQVALCVGVLPLIGFGIHGTLLGNTAWQKNRERERVHHQKLVHSAPEAAKRFVLGRLSDASPERKSKIYSSSSFGPAITLYEDRRSYYWRVSGTVNVIQQKEKVTLKWDTIQYFDSARNEWILRNVQIRRKEEDRIMLYSPRESGPR